MTVAESDPVLVPDAQVPEPARSGHLELWRKWSPAEGLVEDVIDRRWVDVEKSVVKRRFSPDGSEIAYSGEPQVNGAGCDIEVAEVTVGNVRGWTFSFAAFGPRSTRRDALRASWQTLLAATPCPKPLVCPAGRAMGYPEWLAVTAPNSIRPSATCSTSPAARPG